MSEARQYPSLRIRCLAETGGTYAMVLAAAGSVMIDELTGGLLTPVGIALSPGLVVMAMVYGIGRVSGAHINPAVTLGFALTKQLARRDAAAYWAAQLVGAVLAAGSLRLSLGTLAGLGGHTPLGGPAQSLALEVGLTFLLMFVISAVVANPHRVGNASGVLIGGTVSLGIILGDSISGGSMNPARSFGPALVGWSWPHHWLYWVGPLVGASLAVLAYRLLHGAVAGALSTGPDREGSLT